MEQNNVNSSRPSYACLTGAFFVNTAALFLIIYCVYGFADVISTTSLVAQYHLEFLVPPIFIDYASLNPLIAFINRWFEFIGLFLAIGLYFVINYLVYKIHGVYSVGLLLFKFTIKTNLDDSKLSFRQYIISRYLLLGVLTVVGALLIMTLKDTGIIIAAILAIGFFIVNGLFVFFNSHNRNIHDALFGNATVDNSSQAEYGATCQGDFFLRRLASFIINLALLLVIVNLFL